MTPEDRSASDSPERPTLTRPRSGLARVAADALSAVTLRSRVAGLAALLLFVVAALTAGCSHGNRLTKVVRTNKTSVIGTLVAMRPDMVVLKTPDGTTVEIPRTEIASIETPTLSEIAALQGAGSGATAANGGGGTNPSGGASNPAGGGGPGTGQRADAGGGASSGPGAAGTGGGTGPGGMGPGGTGGVPGAAGTGGAGAAGGASDASGQRARGSGSPSGQSGDPGSTASNRVPAGGGMPGGSGTGGSGAGGSGAGGSGAPGSGVPGSGGYGGATGTTANRNPAGGSASGAGASGGSASGASGGASSGGTGAGPAGTNASGRPIILPAYAEMHVALESALGSDTSRAEEDVYATVTQPLTIDGVTRVPAGARLRGTIIEAVPGAKARGQGRLAFRFHTLIVGSTSVPIDTYLVRKVAGRLSKDDAKKIGIGAAIGGAMGKIVTKTKEGLGIGAAAGAGGTAIALSRRPDIHLDSGTTMRIKLQKRVTLPTS